MLSKFFKGRAQPVKIDFREFSEFLQLDQKLSPDPDIHTVVLAALACYNLRGSSQYGPAKSYYSDPDKKVITEPTPIEFSGGLMDDPETYQLSSCISCTEEPAAFGQKFFCIIMRAGSEKPNDLYTSIVFGMRGKIDKNGDYSVTKILAPSIENDFLTRLQDIPVTEDNVHAAMLYGYECARQIYDGEPVMPRKALEFVMAYQEQEHDHMPRAPERD